MKNGQSSQLVSTRSVCDTWDFVGEKEIEKMSKGKQHIINMENQIKFLSKNVHFWHLSPIRVSQFKDILFGDKNYTKIYAFFNGIDCDRQFLKLIAF